ncbi:MAG: endonuclease domain-containing protein [Rhodospirillales bacterium]|nr:endonuclease domain-containing protein [Rhodospirillales bacterium]
MTDAELQLWQKLRARQFGGYYFRRQAPIGSYIADFACHQKKLIVELDGGQHAANQAQDAKKTKWLEGEGYAVLRFWNNDVMDNLEGILERIHEMLEARRGTPSP